MDYQLERWINDGAGANPPLDALMRGLASGAEVGFIALVIVWFAAGLVRRQRRDLVGALTALLASGLGLLLNLVISHIWYRPRPFVDHPTSVHVLLSHSRDASFPSDHAAAAFAIGIVLFSVHRWLGIGAIVVAALVGYARIYVGDHYPSDVIGGAAVGIISALLLLIALRAWRPGVLSEGGSNGKAPGTGSPPASQPPGRAAR